MKKIFGALPSRYARSLFYAARDQTAVADVEQDLQSLDETLTQNPELAAFVLNPGLEDAALRGIFSGLADKLNLHTLTRRFIDLLLRKRRLLLLATIPAYYHRLAAEHEGKIEVTVTTAVEPTPGIKEEIRQHLARRTGMIPQISWIQNPRILGGLIVEWQDRIFDGSLMRKLLTLKQRMVEAA